MMKPTRDDYDEIDHAVEYVNGRMPTNRLENFWSLLERNMRGTYVAVGFFRLSLLGRADPWL